MTFGGSGFGNECLRRRRVRQWEKCGQCLIYGARLCAPPHLRISANHRLIRPLRVTDRRSSHLLDGFDAERFQTLLQNPRRQIAEREPGVARGFETVEQM